MADDEALQGPPSHLTLGSRGRAQIIAPYQPHGFTSANRFARIDSCESHRFGLRFAKPSEGVLRLRCLGARDSITTRKRFEPLANRIARFETYFKSEKLVKT